MTPAALRRVLLVRAFESPLQPPWTAADRDAAGRQAASELGPAAPPELFIARRSEIAFERLAAREPGVHAAGQATPWVGPLLLAAAAAGGVLLDAVGPSGRIDLLAPPLLGVLVWNLLVYLGLAAHAGRPAGPAPLQAAWTTLAGRRRGVRPALREAVADWARRAAPSISARALAWLHAAAAVFAAAALASLYLRGLAFEFRAGWQSTFLDAAGAHRLLSIVLAPASALAGIALPSVDELARLRAPGHPGENAARWIHLWALTVAGVVILPRALLAALAARRARQADAALALPLGEAYFQRLLAQRDATPLVLVVQPYNHRPGPASLAAAGAALGAALGRGVTLTAAAPVMEGVALPAVAAADAAFAVALFAATATPERETHGAFLARLRERAAPGTRLIAAVDETAFRERFTGATGQARLLQRRDAWRRLIDEAGALAVFTDTESDPADAGSSTLGTPA